MKQLSCRAVFILLAASMCLVLPLRLRADEVEITLEEDSLVLGETGNLAIEIRLPEGTSAVFVQALYGRIEPKNDVTSGVWTGSYVPPDQFFPAVDYIIASIDTAKEPLWGISSVELIGQGEVKMKVKPFAPAQVRIGDQLYGPIKANAQGKVTIRVKVPPGVTQGVDELGANVDLQVPPLPRSAVFARYGAAMDPSSTEPMPLLVLQFDQQGGIASGGLPLVTAAHGKVSTPDAGRDGIYECSYIPPTDASVQRDTLSAAIADDNAPPFKLEFSLNKNSIHLGEAPAPVAPPESPVEQTAVRPDPSRVFVSLKGGVAWNAGDLLAGAGEFDAGLRPFSRRARLLGFGVSVGFAYSSEESASGVPVSRAKTVMLPMLATVFMRLPLGKRLALVPDIAIGATWIHNDILLENDGSPTSHSKEATTLFTLGARTTFEILAWKGAFIVHVAGRFQIGELETLDGALSTIEFMAGYRLFLL